jgi:hypothetical protein
MVAWYGLLLLLAHALEVNVQRAADALDGYLVQGLQVDLLLRGEVLHDQKPPALFSPRGVSAPEKFV